MPNAATGINCTNVASSRTYWPGQILQQSAARWAEPVAIPVAVAEGGERYAPGRRLALLLSGHRIEMRVA